MGQSAQACVVSKSLVGTCVAFLRTRLFEIYMLLVSVLIGLVIVFYLRWTRKPREVRWMLRVWSSAFIYGARTIIGMKYRLEGVENIPEGPVLFVGNHQSYWESIAMTVFFPHINVVTKQEAMLIPVFGWPSSRSHDSDLQGCARTKPETVVKGWFSVDRRRAKHPDLPRRRAGSSPGTAALFARTGAPLSALWLRCGAVRDKRRPALAQRFRGETPGAYYDSVSAHHAAGAGT